MQSGPNVTPRILWTLFEQAESYNNVDRMESIVEYIIDKYLDGEDGCVGFGVSQTIEMMCSRIDKREKRVGYEIIHTDINERQ